MSGLGGEPKYSDRFRVLSENLANSLHTRFGVPDDNIAWVGEDTVCNDPHFKGQSTKVGVERQVAAIQRRVKPGEQVVIVLIGHGAGQEGESRISLPGPDITALDLQKTLGQFSAQRVALVNLTSASGDMLPILAAPGRIVITATRTSYERNESHFAEHFVAAFALDVADVDKDGRVSLLEAFRYAARETKRVYDDASKIQTEHSQLDDNGTKLGTADPTGKSGQGLVARRFFFDANAAATAGDATIAGLYREKFDLEGRVDSLRVLKPTMDSTAYLTSIEQALVDLARKSREIRKAEGRP